MSEETLLYEDERNYLRSLVRMDVRRHQKMLERFAPKPGQSAEEAEAMRFRFENQQVFRRDVLDRLGSIPVLVNCVAIPAEDIRVGMELPNATRTGAAFRVQEVLNLPDRVRIRFVTLSREVAVVDWRSWPPQMLVEVIR